jgi:Tim10/DDP family zinc finger
LTSRYFLRIEKTHQRSSERQTITRPSFSPPNTDNQEQYIAEKICQISKDGQHQQWPRFRLLVFRSQGCGHEPSTTRSRHDKRTAIDRGISSHCVYFLPLSNNKQKVNEHCFEKCVPKPGSSLSSGETTCFTQCMEKYMAAWNTVSRQYINRIQQEQGRSSGGGGLF